MENVDFIGKKFFTKFCTIGRRILLKCEKYEYREKVENYGANLTSK